MLTYPALQLSEVHFTPFTQITSDKGTRYYAHVCQ